MEDLLSRLKGGLIVSCQALENEPLHGCNYMEKMALSSKLGGAVAIRANGPDDIRAIKNEVNLPVIGINKVHIKGSSIYITPNIKSAEEIIKAGADIVAIDCTFRKNNEGHFGYELIQEIKERFNVFIMADISNLDEAINSHYYGADIISTTLSGYTENSPCTDKPDFKLIEDIRSYFREHVMINAEGKICTPQDAALALKKGADFVTVGTAITRPQCITESFVKHIRQIS